VILHVRDISHPESAEQAADVADILASLGVTNPRCRCSKCGTRLDLVDPRGPRGILMAQARASRSFPISALTGEGIAPLLDRPFRRAFDEAKQRERDLTLGFDRGAQAGLAARRRHRHRARPRTDEGWQIEVRWTDKQQKPVSEP
jgi:GTPase